MFIAIVPAAGKSTRMGQPKLLLPLGDRRVIEHVLDALGESQVARVVVVLQPGSDELRSVVSKYAKVEVASLPAPTPDMRASIVFGLDYAERQCGPEPLHAFFIALADLPTLSTSVIDQLAEQFLRTSRSIIVPTFSGKRGHPALFDWKLVPQVRALPPDRGVNHLIAQLASEVDEYPIGDAGVLEDLDTPQDYDRIRRSNRF